MLMVYHFNFPVCPTEVLVFVHIVRARNLPSLADRQLWLQELAATS